MNKQTDGRTCLFVFWMEFDTNSRITYPNGEIDEAVAADYRLLKVVARNRQCRYCYIRSTRHCTVSMSAMIDQRRT